MHCTTVNYITALKQHYTTLHNTPSALQHNTRPHHITPHQTIPDQTIPDHTRPDHTIPHHITPDYTMTEGIVHPCTQDPSRYPMHTAPLQTLLKLSEPNLTHRCCVIPQVVCQCWGVLVSLGLPQKGTYFKFTRCEIHKSFYFMSECFMHARVFAKDCSPFLLISWWDTVRHLTWSLLGLADADKLGTTDQTSLLLLGVLYAVFLVMVVVLLVNMLIAVLSNVYQGVEVR